MPSKVPAGVDRCFQEDLRDSSPGLRAGRVFARPGTRAPTVSGPGGSSQPVLLLLQGSTGLFQGKLVSRPQKEAEQREVWVAVPWEREGAKVTVVGQRSPDIMLLGGPERQVSRRGSSVFQSNPQAPCEVTRSPAAQGVLQRHGDR